MSLIVAGSGTNTAGATLAVTGITVPAGVMIGIIVAEASSLTAGSISDGGINTYAEASSMPNGTNSLTHFWIQPNCSALTSATVTYTKRNSGRDTAIVIFYLDNALTSSPNDTTASAVSTFSSSTTPSQVSGTPTVAGELFIGFVSGGFSSFTPDATWTNPSNNFLTIGSIGLGWAYLLNTGTSPKTYAPILGSSVACCIGIETFKLKTFVSINLAMMGM